MKIVPVQDAVGMVIEHDITEIVPGRFKGPAFKRGQIIQPQDVEKLLHLGKEHIAALELEPGMVHEDDAARRLAIAAAGSGIILSDPSEGKVNLIAEINGLLKINVERLNEMNGIADMMLATLHTNQLVTAGQILAGTRVIPLAVKDSILQKGEELCKEGGSIISVVQLHRRKVGIVTTGSEVYHGRIKDKFGPVVKEKLSALGCQIVRQILVPDDTEMTVDAIKGLIKEGAEIVVLTGGMSVDPDDLTPVSIRATGAEVITYGAPILPGAMFMLAYLDDDVPILGLPGCVMYHKASIFDLVMPRILAGERLSRQDFTTMGHGGLCLDCDACHYPKCSFGK